MKNQGTSEPKLANEKIKISYSERNKKDKNRTKIGEEKKAKKGGLMKKMKPLGADRPE